MPSLTPESHSKLLSALRADQSACWQRGERVRVEDYLGRHPDLASDPEALLELVYGEVLLRLDDGEAPTLQEYLHRFVGHSAALRDRWGRFRLLHPELPPEANEAASTASEDRTLPPAPALALPGFEIRRKLGEGGMGVVFEARQTDLDRVVALKVIRAGPLAGDALLSRFRTEERAVARLDHPGVVRIFSSGQHEGWVYFCMEFVPGGSLAGRLRGGPLGIREAADLVRQLALAVQHAHERGVLHRDLKPANVLLVEASGGRQPLASGERQSPVQDASPAVAGTGGSRPPLAALTAKVGDFGLAKLLDADDGMTWTGVVMGTPSYMAPEQADGRTRDVGPATDVWALGVILYECLTGNVPFKGEGRTETLERVKIRKPASPGQLRKEVPADLEAICLRCLEKDPRNRYSTPAALVEDLERWLQGKGGPLKPSWSVRWGRFVCSLRGVAAGTILLLWIAALAFLFFGREPRTKRQDDSGELDSVTPTQRRTEKDTGWVDGKLSTFTGRESLPGPFRSVLGDATPLKHTDSETAFSWSTLTTGLQELTSDPKVDRYVFSAQVRHDDAPGNSRVGIYFGYRDRLTAGGRQSGFYTLSFADRGPAARVRRGPGGKPESLVSLRSTFFELRKGLDWVPGRAVGRERIFQPALPQIPASAPWRELRVKVTRTGVEVFWRDENGKFDRFSTVSVKELERSFRLLKRAEPGMAAISTAFRPRSGLGLYIYRGQASFRHIKVEPLP
jgi:serine/threonine-protein kinase